MKDKKKVLIVEDDSSMGFLLKEYLTENGFDVILCLDGDSGLKTFQQNKIDLCLIDVMLPGMDGFTLAERLKKQIASVPFIFLTARTMKEDKIKGFNLGCDDYVTKPFDEEELLCRIHAVLNRYQSQEFSTSTQKPVYTLADYTFDAQNYALNFQNNLYRLTHRESDILNMLCAHQGAIVRRSDLLNTFWGRDDYFNGRSLDVFITRLRKLLSEDERVKIETVPKVGYILNVDENNQ